MLTYLIISSLHHILSLIVTVLLISGIHKLFCVSEISKCMFTFSLELQ